MDLTKYICMTADDIEGEIGGCAIDDLLDTYFDKVGIDPDDVQWYLSHERSTAYADNEPRYALAIYADRKFLLDLDEENGEDGCWTELFD